MSKLSSEELREKHNEGEQDAANGEAKTGLFDEYGAIADGLNSSIIDGWEEERDAYRSGVETWQKQNPWTPAHRAHK